MTRLQRTGFLTLALLLTLVGPVYAEPVKGKVISAQNEPIPRALIVFQRGDEEIARTTTADDGKFYLRSIDAGTYTVRVSRGSQSKEFPNTRIQSSTQDLLFRL